MKYQVTKNQCQKKIDELKNVCDRCGRKIVPLKTVNNGGEPTYWAGCLHGDKVYGHFTQGVKKEIYDLAIKLILEDSLYFGMSNEDKKIGFDYAWKNAIYRNCDKIRSIEFIKNNKPRYTKKQLIEQHQKYYKNP
jgi:hypothetical protein